MKKGFTLIELLAVILILGIIALIAIPTVNKVIVEAKYGAFKTGNDNIMKTVEQKCQTDLIKGKIPVLSYIFDKENSNIDISIKGKLPNDGYIILNKECSVTNYYLSDDQNTYSNGEDIRNDHMLKMPIENEISLFRSLYTDYYDNIISINFIDNLNIVENAIQIKDPSVSENGKIKSWLVPNGEKYDLYIGSLGKIYGNFNSSYLFENSSATIINLDNFYTDFITNFQGMFTYCLMEYLNVDNWNTSSATNMRELFYRCYNLKSLNLSRWNTSNVVTMSAMFMGRDVQGSYHSLETIGDISNWDTSNVKNMSCLFYACYKLKEIKLTNWDTSNVTNMNRMFYACKSITSLDLSSFNTEKVTIFSNMFCLNYNLSKLNLSNFITSNGKDFSSMFYGCYILEELDLSNFNMNKATNISHLFYGCRELKKINLSNWNIINVSEYSDLFNNNYNFNEIIMHNSNFQSINKIISNLYDNGLSGNLSVSGVDDLSRVDTSVALNKNWNVI